MQQKAKLINDTAIALLLAIVGAKLDHAQAWTVLCRALIVQSVSHNHICAVRAHAMNCEDV